MIFYNSFDLQLYIIMVQRFHSIIMFPHRCALGCLVFDVPLDNFSFIWRRYHYRWRDANLTYTRHSWPLSSEGSLAHTVTRDIRLYGRHRGTVSLTASERLVVEISLPVLTTYVCRGWDSNTQVSACEANTLTNCATAAACMLEYKIFLNFKPVYKSSFKNSF